MCGQRPASRSSSGEAISGYSSAVSSLPRPPLNPGFPIMPSLLRRSLRLIAAVAATAGPAAAQTAASAAAPPAAQTTALRFGRLVDGTGAVVRDAVVVVDGDRVTRVGAGDAAVPAGARVIDLRRYT